MEQQRLKDKITEMQGTSGRPWQMSSCFWTPWAALDLDLQRQSCRLLRISTAIGFPPIPRASVELSWVPVFGVVF
jgi:hypothetical protein